MYFLVVQDHIKLTRPVSTLYPLLLHQQLLSLFSFTFTVNRKILFRKKKIIINIFKTFIRSPYDMVGWIDETKLS